MADTVLNRTVFTERTSDGCHRFADWALVTTKNHGSMAEPFSLRRGIIPGDMGTEFDALDEVAMITEIRNVNSDMIPTMISGGGEVWVGGIMVPRVGR